MSCVRSMRSEWRRLCDPTGRAPVGGEGLCFWPARSCSAWAGRSPRATPPPLRMSSAAARCSPKLSSLRTQHFGMLSGLLQTGAGTKRGRPRACACARGSNGRDASCERGGAEEQWLCGRQWPVGVRVQASGMRRGLRMNSSQGVSQPGFRRALDVTQRAGRASPVRVA